MTNIERIKLMSAKELAEYIDSVFLAGRLFESNRILGKEAEELVDYEVWLNHEED